MSLAPNSCVIDGQSSEPSRQTDSVKLLQVPEPLQRTLCTPVVWKVTRIPANPQDPAPWDSTASILARPCKAWTPPGTGSLICARHQAKHTHIIFYNPDSVSRRKSILSPLQSLSFYPRCCPAPGHRKKCSLARQGQGLSSALPGWEADLACYFCPSQPGGNGHFPWHWVD